MNPTQLYTDLTYGLLLLGGLMSMWVFGNEPLYAGLGIGIFIGYVVHVGSEMVEFSRVQESVEETKEVVESVEQKVDSVEEKTDEVVEKAEKASDQAEETKEAVEKVDEKTSRVEGALNGDPE